MSRLRLYSTQEGARRTISVRNQYCPVVLSLEVLHSGVVNVEKRVTRTWHLCWDKLTHGPSATFTLDYRSWTSLTVIQEFLFRASLVKSTNVIARTNVARMRHAWQRQLHWMNMDGLRISPWAIGWTYPANANAICFTTGRLKDCKGLLYYWNLVALRSIQIHAKLSTGVEF